MTVEPAPELVTTRVGGGGGSPRLIALVVVALLVGLVGFAVVNRPPAAAPAVGAQPTPSPGATLDTRPRATPDLATNVVELVPEGALPIYVGYGVELVVDGRRYPGRLYQVTEDHLSAAYSIPTGLAIDVATVGFAQVSSSYSHDIITPIGDWQIPLAVLLTLARGVTILDERVEGIPDNPEAAPLVREGYRITVNLAATTEVSNRVEIDVFTLASQPPPPLYSYSVSAAITGGVIRVPLAREVEDVFGGSMVINSADVAGQVGLVLSREWSQDGRLQIVETFDAWTVELGPLRRQRGRLVDLLIAQVLPTLTAGAGSEPMASGYTFTVRGRREGTQITLFFEFVWPMAAGPGADAPPRNQIEGNDGLAGCLPIIACDNP